MRYWVFIGAVLLLVAVLMWKFPYVGGQDHVMEVFYLVLLIGFIASSGMLPRMNLSETMRNVALWLGIILLLALGYTFRADIQGTRLYGALLPNAVQITAEGELRLTRGADGHFHVEAEINGAPESFLVDTGASDIILSARAARAAGLDPETLNYSRAYQTANGVVSGAPVRLDTLRIGHITLRDVPASVNRGQMGESLLGMAFLNQFSSYQVQDDILTLTP